MTREATCRLSEGQGLLRWHWTSHCLDYRHLCRAPSAWHRPCHCQAGTRCELVPHHRLKLLWICILVACARRNATGGLAASALLSQLGVKLSPRCTARTVSAPRSLWWISHIWSLGESLKGPCCHVGSAKRPTARELKTSPSDPMATRHVQVRFLNGKSACLELVPGEKVGDLKLGAPGAAVAHATEAAAARVAPFNRGVDKTIQQRGAASGRPGAPKRGGSGRGGHFAGLFQHQASRMLFFA